MNKKIICVCGRTASGKDSLATEIAKEYNLNKIVSNTTRKKRENETNGVEHYFLSNDEFDDIKNNKHMIAYTKIGNYEYGVAFEDLSDDSVYIIDYNGIKYLRNNIADLPIDLYIIYVSCDFYTRDRRAKTRSDYLTSFMKRNNDENEQFTLQELASDYDYIVNNNNDVIDVRNMLLCDEVLNNNIIEFLRKEN